MDQQPTFTFHDLLAFVVGDVAKAIAERSGETEQQRFARSQAAVHMILGFLPRDVIEAMLAGHCVMLHEVMTANVHDTLRGDADAARGRPRSNAVGLNKAFNDTLDRLERYRQRPAQSSLDVPQAQPADACPEHANVSPEKTETTEPPQPCQPAVQRLNRAARRQAARAESRAAATASRAAPRPAVATLPAALSADPKPDPAAPENAVVSAFGSPSPKAIAACTANPEAMAALKSGDPAGFARAMGIAQPCEAFLDAANAKGSPFDSQAPRPLSTDAIAASAKP
jgi:hypothetical protein